MLTKVTKTRIFSLYFDDNGDLSTVRYQADTVFYEDGQEIGRTHGDLEALPADDLKISALLSDSLVSAANKVIAQGVQVDLLTSELVAAQAEIERLKGNR